MPDNESMPKPGHFLPGGAGETAEPTTPARPISAGKSPKTEPLSVQSFSVPKADIKPLSTSSGSFGWAGTQQLGGSANAQPVGDDGLRRQSADATQPFPRPGAQYGAHEPVMPARRFSTPMIAAFSALALVALAGGVVASVRVADSMDNVSSPLVSPSLRPKEAPAPVPAPRPTVTVTAKTVPDWQRVKENKLYQAGQLASMGCQEPAVKPTTKQAVLKYYQLMLPCLNKFWAPVVRKAGYPFRAPKLVVYDNGKPKSDCTGEATTAFYCGSDESINMRWQDDVKTYKQDQLWARVDMMSTMAHEYGHHVQLLTNILISSASREGWAKTKAAKLEENRRMELQASCLSALFLGANKRSLELTGRKLAEWEDLSRHSGDEYDPKKVRDHGSKANHWYWESGAFKNPNPAKCNTFVAPAKRVS